MEGGGRGGFGGGGVGGLLVRGVVRRGSDPEELDPPRGNVWWAGNSARSMFGKAGTVRKTCTCENEGKETKKRDGMGCRCVCVFVDTRKAVYFCRFFSFALSNISSQASFFL